MTTTTLPVRGDRPEDGGLIFGAFPPLDGDHRPHPRPADAHPSGVGDHGDHAVPRDVPYPPAG